jgi:hypothetical protein
MGGHSHSRFGGGEGAPLDYWSWTEWEWAGDQVSILNTEDWYLARIVISEDPAFAPDMLRADIEMIDSSVPGMVGVTSTGLALYDPPEEYWLGLPADLILAFPEFDGSPPPVSLEDLAIDSYFAIGYGGSIDDPQGGMALFGSLDGDVYAHTSSGGWDHVQLLGTTVRILLGWDSDLGPEDGSIYLDITYDGPIPERSELFLPGSPDLVGLALTGPYLEAVYGISTFPADSGRVGVLHNSSERFAANWSIQRAAVPTYDLTGMVLSGPAD